MNYKLRLHLSKMGKAIYISHLDLMATVHRALLRAGIKLRYSEGFNPHPYISAALPLSVGCGSVCELVDVGISSDHTPEGLPKVINVVLPEGLKILDAYDPVRKFNEIEWIKITGVLYYDQGRFLDIAERLAERFKAESIVICKRTKRGTSDFDIAPHISNSEFYEYDEEALREGDNNEFSLCDRITPGNVGMPKPDVICAAVIHAQNPTINPDNLIGALTGEFSLLKPDHALFTRIEVFDKDMNIFR